MSDFILTDRELQRDPTLLSRRWDRADSFVVVSDAQAGDTSWLAELWTTLPASLLEGHFGLLTSGSTGRPKLIIGSRDRAERLARVLHDVQGNEAAQRTVVSLPLSYSFAFVNQWVWSRVTGRQILFAPRAALRSFLEESSTDVSEVMLCMVAAQLPLLLNRSKVRQIQNVSRIHFAGGRFPEEHLDELRTLFPRAKITNNYGCTEALPRLTVRPAEASREALNIGRPIKGVELRTDDEGSLQFRSAYRAVALVVDNNVRMVGDDEWLPTGDKATKLADDSWEIVGRSSEVFKRFGEKVSPAQVTTTLRTSWKGGLAFYLTRDKLGETAHVVVLAPSPSKDELWALLELMKAKLKRAEWPLRIEGRSSFPLLPNDKIDVQSLADTENQILWKQHY